MTSPLQSDSRKPVICLGLTPAVQRTQVFSHFHAGEVNRALETHVTAGGKAVNTGLALALLKRPCVVTGLNGGASGRFVSAYLEERDVTCAWTRMPTPTRTCTTIFDRSTQVATELVEEAATPTAEQLRDFVAGGARRLRRAAMGLICGTLPPRVPEETWATLAGAARQAGVPLVIDSHAAPLLRALACAPLVAKMNVRELEKTFHLHTEGEAAVLAAARRLVAGGARWALITHGPQPALLVGAEAAWRITPPEIDPLSPIGSGDCVTAGLAHVLLNGAEPVEAARFGLGCGSANALTLCPADFAPRKVGGLARACRVERVG